MSQTVVNELGKVTTKHNMQGNLGDASSGSVEDGNNNNDTEAISASWGSKPNSHGSPGRGSAVDNNPTLLGPREEDQDGQAPSEKDGDVILANLLAALQGEVEEEEDEKKKKIEKKKIGIQRQIHEINQELGYLVRRALEVSKDRKLSAKQRRDGVESISKLRTKLTAQRQALEQDLKALDEPEGAAHEDQASGMTPAGASKGPEERTAATPEARPPDPARAKNASGIGPKGTDSGSPKAGAPNNAPSGTGGAKLSKKKGGGKGASDAGAAETPETSASKKGAAKIAVKASEGVKSESKESAPKPTASPGTRSVPTRVAETERRDSNTEHVDEEMLEAEEPVIETTAAAQASEDKQLAVIAVVGKRTEASDKALTKILRDASIGVVKNENAKASIVRVATDPSARADVLVAFEVTNAAKSVVIPMYCRVGEKGVRADEVMLRAVIRAGFTQHQEAATYLTGNAYAVIVMPKGERQHTNSLAMQVLGASGNAQVRLKLVAPEEFTNTGTGEWFIRTVGPLRVLCNVEGLKDDGAAPCVHQGKKPTNTGNGLDPCAKCVVQGVDAVVCHSVSAGNRSALLIVNQGSTTRKATLADVLKVEEERNGVIDKECPNCGHAFCRGTGRGGCIVGNANQSWTTAGWEADTVSMRMGAGLCTGKTQGWVRIIVTGDSDVAKRMEKNLRTVYGGTAVSFGGLCGLEVKMEYLAPEQALKSAATTSDARTTLLVWSTNDYRVALMRGLESREIATRQDVVTMLVTSVRQNALVDNRGGKGRAMFTTSGLYTIFDLCATENSLMDAVAVGVEEGLRRTIAQGRGHGLLQEYKPLPEGPGNVERTVFVTASGKGGEDKALLERTVTTIRGLPNVSCQVVSQVPISVSCASGQIHVAVGNDPKGEGADLYVVTADRAKEDMTTICVPPMEFLGERVIAMAVEAALDRKLNAHSGWEGDDDSTVVIVTTETAEGLRNALIVRRELTQLVYGEEEFPTRFKMVHMRPKTMDGYRILVILTAAQDQILREVPKDGSVPKILIHLTGTEIEDRLGEVVQLLGKDERPRTWDGHSWKLNSAVEKKGACPSGEPKDDSSKKEAPKKVLKRPQAVEEDELEREAAEEEPRKMKEAPKNVRKQSQAAQRESLSDRDDEEEDNDVASKPMAAKVSFEDEEQKGVVVGIASVAKDKFEVGHVVIVRPDTLVREFTEDLAKLKQVRITGQLLEWSARGFGRYIKASPGQKMSDLLPVKPYCAVIYGHLDEAKEVAATMQRIEWPEELESLRWGAPKNAGSRVWQDLRATQRWKSMFGESLKLTEVDPIEAEEVGVPETPIGGKIPRPNIPMDRANDEEEIDESKYTPARDRMRAEKNVGRRESSATEHKSHTSDYEAMFKELKEPSEKRSRERTLAIEHNQAVFIKVERVTRILEKTFTQQAIVRAMEMALSKSMSLPGVVEQWTRGNVDQWAVIDRMRTHYTHAKGDPILEAITSPKATTGETRTGFVARMHEGARTVEGRNKGHLSDSFVQASRKKIILEVANIVDANGLKLSREFVVKLLGDPRPKDESLSKFLEELLQELERREQAETAIRDGRHEEPRGARTRGNAFLAVDEEYEDGYYEDEDSQQTDEDYEEEILARDDHYSSAFMAMAEEGKFRPIHEVVKDGDQLRKAMMKGGIPFEIFYARGPHCCWSCGKEDHWSMQCPTPNPKLPFGPKNFTVMVDKENNPHMFGEPIPDKQTGGGLRLSDHGKRSARLGSQKVNAASIQRKVEQFKNRRQFGKQDFGRGPS